MKGRRMNSIDQIRTYKKLLDEGVLNVDEFNIKKNEALGKADADQADVFELLYPYIARFP